MLTVAPSGRTNLQICGETPFLSQQRIVTGRVAEDESVPKAVARAGKSPFVKVHGLVLVLNQKMAGSKMRPWMPSAMVTAKMYITSDRNLFPKSSDSHICDDIRQQMPRGESQRIASTIFITTWLKMVIRWIIEAVSLESNLDNIMPKKTEKTSTPRIFMFAAASTMLGGHIFKKTSRIVSSMPALDPFLELVVVLVQVDTAEPGCTVTTTTRPTMTARKVVPAMKEIAILASRLVEDPASFKAQTPAIMLPDISGRTIIFRRFKKALPGKPTNFVTMYLGESFPVPGGRLEVKMIPRTIPQRTPHTV
mmetsp:Transcript_5289/g.18762  ORF Transcript_5289/g.18762 Transcript_5289/m.18762 type:complete len:308 (-) Transcript_5289:203-1126(-)